MNNLNLNAELIQAADRGDAQSVRDLLKQGADPNSSAGGTSALYFSTAKKHLACSIALLEAGANPDTPFSGKPLDGIVWTPLYAATHHADIAHVELLLRYKASINSDVRYTPFFRAALNKEDSPERQEIYELYVNTYLKRLEKNRADKQEEFIKNLLHPKNLKSALGQYADLKDNLNKMLQCLQKQNATSDFNNNCILDSSLSPIDKDPNAFAVIVMRYALQPAKWLKYEFPTENCIIVNKGNKTDLTTPPNCKVIEEENIGWFGGSILKYFYDNYDDLPKKMLFAQDDPFAQSMYLPMDRYKGFLPSLCNSIIAKCTPSTLGFETQALAKHTRRDWEAGKYAKFLPEDPNLPPMAINMTEYVHLTNGNYASDTPLAVNLGAEFAIYAAQVRKHPKEFYKKKLEYFTKLREVNDFSQEKTWDLDLQPADAINLPNTRPALWQWTYITDVFAQEGLTESYEYYKYLQNTEEKLKNIDSYIQDSPKIPHITHTMYFSNSPTPKYMNNVSLKNCIEAANKLNAVDPNFKHYFWTNDAKHVPPSLLNVDNVEVHLIDEFKDHILWDNMQRNLNRPAGDIAALVQLSDFVRWPALEKFGGFYHDADGRVYDAVSLVKYMDAYNFFGTKELKTNDVYIASATIGASPNHPITLEAIRLMERNTSPEMEAELPSYFSNPNVAITIKQSCDTGPMMASIAYANMNNIDGNIDLIFPRCAMHNLEYTWYNTPGTRCSTNIPPSPVCEFNGITLNITCSDGGCGDWYGQMM